MENSTKTKKRKRDKVNTDDAPRAFKRLMLQATGKLQSGLDDGQNARRRRKNDATKNKADRVSRAAGSEITTEIPRIQPGERLSDYARRVDAALPLKGLAKSAKGGDPLGLAKVFRTKKERKMHRLYDQWRQEEAKIQEQREEELEKAEEEELEREANGTAWKIDKVASIGQGKRKGKNIRRKFLGETIEAHEDPWDELKQKRGEAKIGLHDVVDAPPELAKKPKKIFAVRGSAAVQVDSIPKSAGSLRRREELQTVRRDVVEAYRELMSTKRPSLTH